MTPTTSFVPADTRSMGIVHNALRRDLTRAREVLSTAPYPHSGQRQALAAHLSWMVAFVHRHHETEESGLFPLVRRDPAAGRLLDEMEAQHAALLPAMAGLELAAAGYATDATARPKVVAALDELIALMYSHLQREEDELMPVTARVVSRTEWDAFEQGMVSQLSMKEKTEIGLWVLEGASPQDTDHMVKVIPPVPRWLILNVFSRGYRKQAFARWLRPEHSPWKLASSCANTVTVPATPEQLWAMLADITRVGEWSHECRSARWLHGATAGGVGVRFAGSNRTGLRLWRTKAGHLGWIRRCEITSWVPARELVYETQIRNIMRDSSQWSFILEPVEGGTRLTQTYRLLRLPVLVDRLAWAIVPAHRDRGSALRADLERLGRVAAAAPVATPTTAE